MAGRVADAVTRRRVSRRPAPPQDLLVVSVGNLRVGGTGKTPVVLSLARDLLDRGHRGAVLLRGYGSKLRAARTVSEDDRQASDEARLLAAGLKNGQWIVVQARDRLQGLDLLRAAEPRPGLVILDDGFQTAGVGRHLDVLILDSWNVREGRIAALTGAVLPFGPYRETAAGAKRAHVWLLETEAWPPGAGDRERGMARDVFCFHRRHFLAPVDRDFRPDGHRMGLVCGIARPERFEAVALGILQERPVVTVRCRDHCEYDQATVDRLAAVSRRHGVTAWVTTAKDWIKLQARWPETLSVVLVHQEVVWSGSKTLPDLVEERLVRFPRSR